MGIIETAHERQFLSLGLLCALEYPRPLDQAWIDFFCGLGERYSRLLRFSAGRHPEESALPELLEGAFITDPKRRGSLLNVLRAFAASGHASALPPELLKDRYDDPALRDSFSLLRLTQGNYSGEETNAIAQYLAHDIRSTLFFLQRNDPGPEHSGIILALKDVFVEDSTYARIEALTLVESGSWRP